MLKPTIPSLCSVFEALVAFYYACHAFVGLAPASRTPTVTRFGGGGPIGCCTTCRDRFKIVFGLWLLSSSTKVFVFERCSSQFCCPETHDVPDVALSAHKSFGDQAHLLRCGRSRGYRPEVLCCTCMSGRVGSDLVLSELALLRPYGCTPSIL